MALCHAVLKTKGGGAMKEYLISLQELDDAIIKYKSFRPINNLAKLLYEYDAIVVVDEWLECKTVMVIRTEADLESLEKLFRSVYTNLTNY